MKFWGLALICCNVEVKAWRDSLFVQQKLDNEPRKQYRSGRDGGHRFVHGSPNGTPPLAVVH